MEKNNEIKKTSKIISGKVTIKSKSPFQKLLEAFISQDAPNIKNYLIYDVAIPTIKKSFLEGLSMLLGVRYNSTNIIPGSTVIRSSNSNYTNYSGIINNQQINQSKPRPTYSYNNIVLESPEDAMAVLNELRELIADYGIASVQDLYINLGLECDHTANKFGWDDLSTADFVKVPDGYLLRFPKVNPIKNFQ